MLRGRSQALQMSNWFIQRAAEKHFCGLHVICQVTVTGITRCRGVTPAAPDDWQDFAFRGPPDRVPPPVFAVRPLVYALAAEPIGKMYSNEPSRKRGP